MHQGTWWSPILVFCATCQHIAIYPRHNQLLYLFQLWVWNVLVHIFEGGLSFQKYVSEMCCECGMLEQNKSWKTSIYSGGQRCTHYREAAVAVAAAAAVHKSASSIAPAAEIGAAA